MRFIKSITKKSAILLLVLFLVLSMLPLQNIMGNASTPEIKRIPETMMDQDYIADIDNRIVTNKQERSDGKYYFTSAIERYYQESLEQRKTKPTFSRNLLSMLATTPREQWDKKEVRLIVVYDKTYPTVRLAINSIYEGKMLKNLPIAYVETTLEKAEKIMNLKGIKGVYLDQYMQFIDPAWKERESKTMTYPSEAYIGARFLQELGINGSGIKIAIIDTGIDKTHPDLDDMDNDPNTNDPKVIAEKSFVDYNFDGVNDTDANDQYGHGTHCAGIAAANGALKGVAPGAYLMNARALDARGWAYISWIVNAIDWAVDNGADIISMSLGWAPGDVIALLNDAVDAAWEKGTMVVVAAGNSGPSSTTVSSPGMASRALTVGASDVLNLTTYWSSRGPSTNGVIDPDIVAPGENILSTVPYNGYDIYSGTSMATPAVAGVAALLRSAYPNVDIDFIRSAIISTATDLNLSTFAQGAGLVNAKAAYYYLSSPSVYAFPGFDSSHPLLLSPNERFSYQFDIFTNTSYSDLSIEPSSALAPYINISFIDNPTSVGWIRANIDIVMSSVAVNGELYIKDDSTVLYTVPLCLTPDFPANDADSHSDAGETIGGAIPLSVGVKYYGSLHDDDLQDFYSFPVTAGHSYRITLSELIDDIDLILTDENGTIITFSANWDSEDEVIEFQALTTGNYYIRVIRYDYGDYTLKVEEIASAHKSFDVTGVFDSYGVDEDSDGLYDALVITVEANVTKPGKYYIAYTVCQYRSDYAFPKYYITSDTIFFDLVVGLNVLELRVKGSIIQQSNYDGPYVLAELGVFLESYWIPEYYENDIYVTESYSHTQFDPPEKVSLYSIDYSETNLDGQGGPELYNVGITFDFNYIGTAKIKLYVIDSSHYLRLAYLKDEIEISTYGNKLVVFKLPTYYYMKFDKIVIAAVVVELNFDALFIPIYNTIDTSVFADYEPLLSYAISETVMDLDQSGKFETLRLTIDIESKIDANIDLRYMTSLFSITDEAFGGPYDYSAYSTFSSHLTVGSNQIKIDLGLKSLAGRGLDGPYLVPYLALKLPDYSLTLNSPHTTNYYDHKDFDTPTVYFSRYLGSTEVFGPEGGIQMSFIIGAKTHITAIMELWLAVTEDLQYTSFYLSEDVSLNKGENIINMTLPYDTLFSSKFIGDLFIKTINIYDPTTYKSYDYVSKVAIIHNIDYRKFDENYEAYIIDFISIDYFSDDNDTLFEGINVSIAIKVNQPDSYQFHFSAAGVLGFEHIEDKTIQYSTAGEYVLSFIIPSQFVGTILQLSNYLYLTVELFRSSTGWSDSSSRAITVVFFNQFDYTPIITYEQLLSCVPFDNEQDGLYDGIRCSLELNSTLESHWTVTTRFSTIDLNDELLDSFEVTTEIVLLTEGINNLQIEIDTTALKYTETTLKYLKEEEFKIVVNYILFSNEENRSVVKIDEVVPTVFNISDFDLRPLCTVTDASLTLEDRTGDKVEDYLIAKITLKFIKPAENVKVQLELYISYTQGSDQYYSYHQTWQYLESVPASTKKVTFEFNLYELLPPEVKEFTASGYIIVYSNNKFILSYDTGEYNFRISSPYTTTITTTTTTTETKKGSLSLIVLTSFLTLGIIALTKRRKSKKK